MPRHRPVPLLLLFTAGLAATACGGRGRVLSIKSEPADAEVCIKGKANSEYFSNAKSCVGTTPFEADRVDVKNADGDRHTVKFKDVEAEKESFYVVVTHPGYTAQALDVPEWEHTVRLRPIGAASYSRPVSAAEEVQQQAVSKSSIKIVSEPAGALVYLNDALKGNTPFTYAGPAGQVKVRLELEGYQDLEKTLQVEPEEALALTFKLISKPSR